MNKNTFTIGQLSRMTGLSVSVIRYYETTGLISPTRGENQKYRNYSIADFILLVNYEWYRSIGFSLEETNKLIHKSSFTQLQSYFEARKQALQTEIERKIILNKIIDEYIESIKPLKEGRQPCSITRNPGLFRIKVWQMGYKESEYISYAQAVAMFGNFAFAIPCLLLSPDDILNGSGDLIPDWGVAIEQKTARIIGLQQNEVMERIPSQTCIQVFLEQSKNLTINADQFVVVREFLTKNHFKINGPAIILKMYHIQMGSGDFNKGHMYIPVKKEK
jgi:DNA-binding transcriptional MerR regulator